MEKPKNILKLKKSSIDDSFSDEVFLADAVKLPLTEKQSAVIFCLQQGCCLITSDQYKGAEVAGRKGQFHIDNGIFWRLVKMGLIKQTTWESKNFDYILTPLGKKVITKKFDLENII